MNKKLKLSILSIGIMSLFLLSLFSTPAIAAPAKVEKQSALPAELVFCGVFPIEARPDAGPDRRDAFLIAVDEINGQTGANRILPVGTTIKPVVQDDLNTAAGGTTAAQNCITSGSHIVIGSSGSTVSKAIATELNSEPMVQISYASSSPSLSNRTDFPWFMRNVGSDTWQASAVVDVVKAFGFTKGAAIHTDDSYGTGLVDQFVAGFGALETDQSFKTGADTTALSIQIQVLKDKADTGDIEFILLHAVDKDAKNVFKKAFDLGLTGRSDLMWFITDGSSSTATFSGDEDVKSAMQNVIGTKPGTKGSKYSEFEALWNSETTCGEGLAGGAIACGKTRSGGVPNSYAPLSYDAVFIAAKGFKASGEAGKTFDGSDKTGDATNLLAKLYAVTFSGAGGDYAFDTAGEVVGRYDIVQLDNETYNTLGFWVDDPTWSVESIKLPGGVTATKDSDGKFTVRSGGAGAPGFGIAEAIFAIFGVGTLVTLRKK